MFPLPVEVSVELALSVTGSLNDCAPVVTIEPPLTAVEPAASVVRLESDVVPPAAPPNVVVPAVFTVSENAPLTVLEKETLPLPVEVSVEFVPSVTASLNDCAPVVVTEPPFKADEPPALVFTLERDV